MYYKEWIDKYENEKLIDLNLYLTERDFSILKKLGIELKDNFCTGVQYETFRLEVGNYEYYEDMTEEDMEGIKFLKDVDVTDNEYNSLLDNLKKADDVYDELLKKCKFKSS